MQEKGSISIHTENIFPIIKKFLYSDHEIFLRELVSNGVDACQKISKLSASNEFKGELGELKVEVSFDKEAKTITISDKGLGMTADEIKKYINQIAFSGATEFIEKYKDDESGKQNIIGHFGLGFYSAFMVAKDVEIQTLSYQEGAQAARWICDGSTEFEISEGNRTERGTDIILHIADDSVEFLEEARLKGILDKYCKFLPVEVYLGEEKINETTPLWTKAPADLNDEDYIEFYKTLYPMAEDPLFWIHLNVDYPFNLTGVLYFPKFRKEVEMQRNKIQLYSRQVFITDEVKDIVPDFLVLMHGVIDSPDIPLNVSRSYLQADGNVKKINSHITKKVADKLKELFNNDRPAFEEKWDSVGLFVKYGMITDEKFYERASKFCLLKDTEDKHYTIEEYKETITATQTDKDENLVILYTTDKGAQDNYIQTAKAKGYNVLEFGGELDAHFVSALEQKLEKVQLRRVDSDTVEKLIDKDEKLESVLSEDQQNKLKEAYEGVVNKEQGTVAVDSMAPKGMPVTVTQPEFFRRMKETNAMGGMAAMFGGDKDFVNVVVNGNHPLNIRIADMPEGDDRKALIKQAYDLGLLAQGMLKGPDLTAFLERSAALIG